MQTRPAIIQMVMIKMDELTPYSEGLTSISPSLQPLKPIQTTIDAVLNECATDLLLSHPINRLEVTNTTPVLTPKSDGSGTMPLPLDFLRLVSFQVVGFVRPVTELLDRLDPRVKLQYQRYTRGGKAKPVAVREITNLFHYFSLSPLDTHTLDHFSYIKNQLPETLSDDLVDGLTWLTASKALTALGHINEAQKAFEFFTLFNSRR
jgi:hypothetical protein